MGQRRAAKVDRALRARCYQFAASPPYFNIVQGTARFP